MLLHPSECPFTTAFDILHKYTYKKSYKYSICKIVANQLSPYSTETFTATEGLQKQIAEIISEFHIESRKFLVELFTLDQLDIKFLKAIA